MFKVFVNKCISPIAKSVIVSVFTIYHLIISFLSLIWWSKFTVTDANNCNEMKPSKKRKMKQKAQNSNEKSEKVKPKKNFKKGKSETKKTSCMYPKSPDEVSLNWKNFCAKFKVTNEKSSKQQVNKKTPAKVQKQDNKPDIWFDDVDKCLIEESREKVLSTKEKDVAKKSLVNEKSFKGLTNVVAMDCEMVGVGEGGKDSVLARISIVNLFGHCLYDKYVKATEKVTDYRTAVSGIRPSDLINAEEFSTVQKEAHDILKGRTVVGHSVKNDFQVLYLSHPKHKIRDTSRYFRYLFSNRTPSLKKLTERVLGVQVQDGEHCSVEDARAAMRLYTLHKKKWESAIASKQAKRKAILKKKEKKK